MAKWYQELFTNFAKTYDKEMFTQGTMSEVDFIEKEINYDRTKSILDVGCGTGRHAIELAKRGYKVTGIDLSASQLARAREKAEEAGVKINFLRADARKFDLGRKFDLVIMLCEGGFSLMETDEENFKILKQCSKALKKDGKFIFTMLNALFPLMHSVKAFLNKNQASGPITKLAFDWTTLRENSVLKAKDDNGKPRVLRCNERYYMPSEITWLLHSLGFKKIGVFGCTIGKFNRKQKPSADEFELIAIAEGLQQAK